MQKERAEERERMLAEEMEMKMRIEFEEKQKKEQEEIEMKLRMERELEEKAKMKENLTRSMIETINQNMEKVKEEMIQRTLTEMNKNIDNMNNIESISTSKIEISKNFTVHHGFTCDGCNTEPIIGCRYKCTVCHDFDFCESCETKFGDEHKHPLIKHREEFKFNRFAGRMGHCRRFDKDDPKPSLLRFLEDKVRFIKDFFQRTEGAAEDELKEKKDEIKIDTTVNTDEKKEDEIKIEDEAGEEEKEKYRRILNDMRERYFFGDFTDDQLLNALVKTLGNMDEALELLLS
jgi:next-to-BRCA1 protein 1